MSDPVPPSPVPPRAGPTPVARSLLVVVIATFFTVLLIWTEIWLALAAAAWSLASMFDFGIAGYLLVAIVAGPLALWASWKTLVLAWAAERSDTY